ALEDLELGGARIARGQRVWLTMASANRDGAAFDRPDDFDVARPAPKHLGFGFGAHFCVGAALGRIEAEVALETLFRRTAALHPLAGPPPRLANFTIRGFAAYPVDVSWAG